MFFKNFIIWLDGFEKAKEKQNRIKILDLFERVKNITSLSNQQILQGIDFDSKNTEREKLESLLSELRAVMFLHKTDFKNIKLLPKYSKRKNFDICANRNNKFYAIEVACLTQEHSRRKEKDIDAYKIKDSDFIETLYEIAERKKLQLDVADHDYVKMLIFVINRVPEVQLCGYDDYKRTLQALDTKLRWGNDYYFGLITGTDDLVYPEIPPIVLD